MYVRKSVWDNYATRISDMIPREATATLTSMVAQESPNDNPLTNIRWGYLLSWPIASAHLSSSKGKLLFASAI
jgi:hypothetical protein